MCSHQNRLNEAILMSTQNIPLLNTKKENHPKLSQICIYGIYSKGPKNEFETAMVNEPSVFEPLKFYSMAVHLLKHLTLFIKSDTSR